MKNIKLFKKGDIIVIAVVILAALILLLPKLFNSDRLTATIWVDGEITQTIELDEVEKAYTITPKSGTTIEVQQGKIRFAQAVCRDKLCVNSGWLDTNGQTAACLPERIVVSISGSDGSPDMLTY